MSCAGRKAGLRQGSGKAQLSLMVLGFHLPGDGWLLSGEQLPLALRGQTWTQHSGFLQHMGPCPRNLVAGPEQKRRWLCSQSSGDWLPVEDTDTRSFHDFYILRSSWRGFWELGLPCSLPPEMLPYSLYWLWAWERGAVGCLNSNSGLAIIDCSILILHFRAPPQSTNDAFYCCFLSLSFPYTHAMCQILG